MINKKLQDALNDQINQELTASYNYLAMSSYFEDENLDGFAKWMYLQSLEETEHAMKLLRYLQDRGGSLKLQAIDKPRDTYANALEAFRFSLQQEQENTNSINKLYEIALELNDHATKSQLQWFLDEQVEEEKSCEDVIAQLERIDDNPVGILFLNDKLGARQPEEEE